MRKGGTNGKLPHPDKQRFLKKFNDTQCINYVLYYITGEKSR